MDFSPVFIVIIALAGALVPLFIVLSLLRRRQRAMLEGLTRKLAAEEGTLIIKPQGASFQGSTGRFGVVKNNGVMFLSEQRIGFHPLVGSNVLAIQREELASVSIENSFKGKWVAGARFLVIHLHDGVQVGFIVKDPDIWQREIENLKR